MSGEGARRFGGRFNPRGMPALYTALKPETAIKEANQAGTLQPTLLVSYQADCADILDLTDPAVLDSLSITDDTLSDDNWRSEMLAKGQSTTQSLAQKLYKQGKGGILVPSYARGATPKDRNLVLWTWTGLKVIDDEHRL